MNNIETNKVIYQSIIDGFNEVFKILWTIDEFKPVIIGIPVSIITFNIVGTIFRWGRSNDIWFGRIGGKILHYLINTYIIWLVMKIV